MAFTLHSPAFANGQPIPAQFARDTGNRSPPLEWRDAPAGIRSFALIMDDPDAPSGLFRHWGVYDIEAVRTALPGGLGANADHRHLRHTVNDFGQARYDGPAPPPDHGVHHYHFHLLALDIDSLNLARRARVEDLRTAAHPHVIAEAELVGTYRR